MCLLDVTVPNRVMGIYLGCLVTRAKKASRGLQYVGSSILLHFIACVFGQALLATLRPVVSLHNE